MECVNLQPYHWESKEVDDHTQILCWAMDEDSNSHLARFENFNSIAVLELPRYINGNFFEWNSAYAEHFFQWIKSSMERIGKPAPLSYIFDWYQDLYYYQGRKKKPYMQLFFRSFEKGAKKCRDYFSKRKEFFIGKQRIGWVDVKVHEMDIPVIRKMLTFRNCKFSGWLKFTGVHPEPRGYRGNEDADFDNVKVTYDNRGQMIYETVEHEEKFEQISKLPLEREWICDWTQLIMTPETEDVVKKSTFPKILAYDIEVYSHNIRRFPDMDDRKDCVFMISCVYQRMGDSSTRKYHCYVYGDLNHISPERWESLKDAEIVKVDDELEVINGFVKLVNEYDPEVLTGYNVYDFDNPYMDSRLKLAGDEIWPQMGRLYDSDTYLHDMSWESNGYGINVINDLRIPGRITVDMLPVIRREHKLLKYNLETVAQHFLDRGKHDVTPQEMFLTFDRNRKACKEWSKEVHRLERSHEETLQFLDTIDQAFKAIGTELDIASETLVLPEVAEKWRKEREYRNEEIRKCIYASSFQKSSGECMPPKPSDIRPSNGRLDKETIDSIEKRRQAWIAEFESKYSSDELLEIRAVYSRKEAREELIMHDNINDPSSSPMYTREGNLNWCSAETWEHLVSLAVDSIDNNQITLPDGINRDLVAEMAVGKFLMTRIVVYCLFDSDLCIELFEKLTVWVSLIQMSSVVGVTPVELFTRGQQIRCLSQLYDLAAKRGYVLNTRPSPDIYFNGGFVFDVTPGIYDGVMVEDFKSLYPSIIIAYNICYTTLLAPRDFIHDGKPNTTGLNPEQITTITVPRPDSKAKDGAEYDMLDDKGEDQDVHEDEESEVIQDRKKQIISSLSNVISDQENFYFQYVNKDVKEGLLPVILKELLGERARVRKEQKKYDKSDLMWKILEEKQKAVKVSANSIFGFLGAGKMGKRPLIEGAMSITSIGRNLIGKVNSEVEEKYGCKVVYGDSVTPDTPILCRLNEKIFYRTIDDLPSNEEWELYHGDKEQRKPIEGLEVWSDEGFTPIKWIIRHKTNKNILRVTTHTGSVKVTTDHSLLRPNGSEVRPMEINLGDELMTQDMPKVGGDYSIKFPWTCGLFYGDGSCGRYDCPSGNKCSWAINNTNLDYLQRAKKEMEESYETLEFVILDTMKSSGVYKLVPKGNGINKLVDEWRDNFYDNSKYKIVPDWLWESNEETRRLFLEGYYCADGDKDKNGYNRFDNKGMIGSAGLYLLSSSLGYNVSINTRKDKLNIYRLTLTKSRQKRNPQSIKKIEDLGPSDDYVYDLETGNHHFGAGVGKLIVHNTDSSMFSKSGIPPNEYNALGRRLGVEMTKGFRKPLELEFEKTMRMLALARKKYAGYLYEDDGSFVIDKKTGLPELYIRGNVLARRDNTKWLRETFEKLLRMALDFKPISEALTYLVDRVEEFMYGEIDYHELITVRSIGAHYKDQNYFMKLFADRLNRMGTPVRPGERIGYLVTKGRNDTEKKYVGNRMITPEMYRASRYDAEPFEIDRLYYLEKQFMNALDQLFWAGYKDKLEKYIPIQFKKKNARKYRDITHPVELMVYLISNGRSLNELRESINAIARNDPRGPALSTRWESNNYQYPKIVIRQVNPDLGKVRFAIQKMRAERVIKREIEIQKETKHPPLQKSPPIVTPNQQKRAIQFN